VGWIGDKNCANYSHAKAMLFIRGS